MKKDTSKSTILVIMLGFLALHLLFKQQWTLYTALAIGVAGAFSDWAAEKIEWLWFKLADVLSKIVPSILLAIVFYLILFPMSVVSKLFTKDPLLIKNNCASTFRDVGKRNVKSGMEKTW